MKLKKLLPVLMAVALAMGMTAAFLTADLSCGSKRMLNAHALSAELGEGGAEYTPAVRTAEDEQLVRSMLTEEELAELRPVVERWWQQRYDVELTDEDFWSAVAARVRVYMEENPELFVEETGDETDTSGEETGDETDTSGEETGDETDTSDEETGDESDTSDEETEDESDTSDEETEDESDTSDEETGDETDTSDEGTGDETDVSDEETEDETDTSDEETEDETDTSDEGTEDESDHFEEEHEEELEMYHETLTVDGGDGDEDGEPGEDDAAEHKPTLFEALYAYFSADADEEETVLTAADIFTPEELEQIRELRGLDSTQLSDEELLAGLDELLEEGMTKEDIFDLFAGWEDVDTWDVEEEEEEEEETEVQSRSSSALGSRAEIKVVIQNPPPIQVNPYGMSIGGNCDSIISEPCLITSRTAAKVEATATVSAVATGGAQIVGESTRTRSFMDNKPVDERDIFLFFEMKNVGSSDLSGVTWCTDSTRFVEYSGTDAVGTIIPGSGSKTVKIEIPEASESSPRYAAFKVGGDSSLPSYFGEWKGRETKGTWVDGVWVEEETREADGARVTIVFDFLATEVKYSVRFRFIDYKSVLDNEDSCPLNMKKAGALKIYVNDSDTPLAMTDVIDPVYHDVIGFVSEPVEYTVGLPCKVRVVTGDPNEDKDYFLVSVIPTGANRTEEYFLYHDLEQKKMVRDYTFTIDRFDIFETSVDAEIEIAVIQR